MTVFNLKVNQTAKIVGVFASGATLKRLNSLGIVRGQLIKVLAFSFFSGSVLIACDEVRVSIRKSLAEKIEVTL
ncbi:MAG: ferrous iron transport protein A [Clostridiales bacterium]|nr:ferrous iron transport protein A [Clostridiales bacterium]